MRKNLHGKILKEKPKEYHLNIVLKSCSKKNVNRCSKGTY